MNNHIYTGYTDLLSFFKRKAKESPKGVSLKLVQNKYIQLQFILPDTGKRSAKSCNCNFTEEGVILALAKANKVAEALKKFKLASDFWNWYDLEILEKNEIENDLKTYGEIFKIIENKFWNSRNKNTKRKRSKDIPNDISTYIGYYGIVFDKFNPNDYPNWESLKSVLFSWQQGSKSFKDAYFVMKQIANLSADSKNLSDKLDDIDYRQTEFKEKQSISLDQFLDWHTQAYNSASIMADPIHKKSRLAWLWVASMCVVYGLRPSEIASAKNLTEPITLDGVHFKAISDKSNHNMLLLLGDKTYFGTTIKTGSRICKPMSLDRDLLDKLHIYDVMLPKVNSNGENLNTFVRCFSHQFNRRIKAMDCPVTQAYAFRHLANQLGEKYGVPQEIRARSLGHSVSINDSVYKARSNTQTTVDLLTNHSKQPLTYDMAISQLKSLGLDTESKEIQLILKVIYQL